MKLKNAMLAACLTLGALSGAHAGSATGKVQSIAIREGLVYITLTGAPSGRPACALGSSYFMIKDENSSVGRQQMALALSAMNADRNLYAEGAGTCTKWPDGEDLRELGLAQ
jgi:hypothetical protein